MTTKKRYNVLIIDDHQIIIDIYINALNFVENSQEDISFNIEYVKDCDSAHEKIINASDEKRIDLIFLDIHLPPSIDKNFFSGEDLGIKIRKQLPNAKIIVSTALNDNFRLNNIIKTINPDCFLIKSDICFNDLKLAIKGILRNEAFYSKTIINLLRSRASSYIVLDRFDLRILYEMANGARMKDLISIIPLSKAGIEKRKRILKEAFNIRANNDRGLIISAKERGFI